MAHAATYYVSKAGSNTNSCAQAQSTSTPKLTIAGGLSCLVAGDTLLVRAGTYAEGMVNNVPSGTNMTTGLIRIANYDREEVWLSGQPVSGLPFGIFLNETQHHIEFDGINTTGIIGLTGTTHHIRVENAEIFFDHLTTGAAHATVYSEGSDHEFRNLEVHGKSGAIGIYVHGNGARVLVEGCEIYRVAGTGIQVRQGTADNIVRNNVIRDIFTSYFFQAPDARIRGIIVGDGASNTQVYNNLIYNIDLQNGLTPSDVSSGIFVYTATNSRIWNNTITNVELYGIRIDPGASNTEVKNNIAYGNSGAQQYKDNGSGTTQSNNLFGVDPLFVDAKSNFQLRDGSPAIDRGTPLVPSDIAKVARPQGSTHDIGAYEASGGQQQASGPPAPPTGVRIVN